LGRKGRTYYTSWTVGITRTHEVVGKFTSVSQYTSGEALMFNDPPAHMALLDAA